MNNQTHGFFEGLVPSDMFLMCLYVVSGIGYLSYAIAIVKGRTSPTRFTWLIASIAMATASYVAYRAGFQQYRYLLIHSLCSLCVFILAWNFRPVKKNLEVYETVAIVLCIVSVVLLYVQLFAAVIISLISCCFPLYIFIKNLEYDKDSEISAPWIIFTTVSFVWSFTVTKQIYAGQSTWQDMVIPAGTAVVALCVLIPIAIKFKIFEKL